MECCVVLKNSMQPLWAAGHATLKVAAAGAQSQNKGVGLDARKADRGIWINPSPDSTEIRSGCLQRLSIRW